MTARNYPTDDGVTGPDGTVDPAFRVAVSYIDRSRRYYRAKGYEIPYRWASHHVAPFRPLAKPLPRSRLAVVTTAFPLGHQGEPKEARSVRAVPADPPPESMFTADLFWHKKATNTDDVESFLPLRALARFTAEGRIGSLNHRFFSVPTLYSQRRTVANAETVSQWCRADEVDVVLLIPL